MPNFSTIVQTPEIRAIVQERFLERAFHDALFPKLLYRMEAAPQIWAANVGDSRIFSAPGLLPVDMRPLTPGTDPTPTNFTYEQWAATLNEYAATIDTNMPTSIAAIASLFYRNCQQLGLMAGQTLNNVVRDYMFNAAESGHTVADGAQVATTTLAVKRLNGFTTARRPDLPLGSPVTFSTVSTNNPLAIIVNTGSPTAVNVIGFTSATAGDEIGPGTLTLDAAVTVADRAYVQSYDRTVVGYVGGGNQVDDVGANDIIRLADIRSAISTLRNQNVPTHGDGLYHAQIDPTAESQVFSDPENQRLLTSLPDYYMASEFAIGKLFGAAFLRNTQSPQPETVVGGTLGVFSENDPIACELYNNGNPATGIVLHRTLFSGQGGIMEYYQDPMWMLTEAGVTGKVGDFSITNNAIEVMTDRIQLVIRAPIDRLQQIVSSSWKFIGAWSVRTDAATGSKARFKRFYEVISGS